MSRVLRLSILLLFSVALAALLSCEGDQGPTGPQGNQGPPGQNGQDLSSPPPADAYFSIAVLNDYFDNRVNYRGKDFVRLTFDSTLTPTDSRVVAHRSVSPPIIDGEDGGEDEWGLTESTITLESAVGDDNAIGTAKVRCLYDSKYVYFMVKWTEAEQDGFATAPNRDFMRWRYRTSPNGFVVDTADGGEDRLWLAFLLNRTYTPATSDTILEGSLQNAKLGLDQRVDFWDWRACLTDLVGYADDGFMTFSGSTNGGLQFDVGGSAYLRNERDTLPAWMRYNQPRETVEPPLWFRDAIAFNPTPSPAWQNAATIPGYLALLPYGDRADVNTFGRFDNKTWVVEYRRLRNTGSGNDIQF